MNQENKRICFQSKEFYLFCISTVVLILAVGFRPDVVGTDTVGYISYYVGWAQNPGYEYLFTWLTKILSGFSVTPGGFLTAIAFVDFLIIFWLGKELISYTERRISCATLFFLLTAFFYLSPFFYAVMVNVIRTGPAIFALFIFYLSLVKVQNSLHLRTGLYLPVKMNVIQLLRAQSLYSLLILSLLLIIAMGFHHTAIIAIVFSPLVFLSYTTILSTVLIASLYYLSGLSTKIVQTMVLSPNIGSLIVSLHLTEVYERFQFYMGSLISPPRWDFTLFTLGLGMICQLANYYFLSEEDRLLFSKLLKIYWVLVLPFFIFGFTAFPDRYLLPGWVYLSVLSAVFCGLYLRTRPISNYWLYGGFLISAVYFFLRVQGYLIFKLR